MKYIVLLGDGMSDEPLEALGGKTPLQAAKTPNMDFMAANGILGLAQTVPEGLPPGSDVANLSVFGYDPRTCYTGRSPLEAASIGVEMGPSDVAFRVNLVTLHPHAGKLYMEDFSAGHISSDEGRAIIEHLQKNLGSDDISFYPGVGYRHLMIWHNGKDALSATPPHDITGKNIINFLPTGEGADCLMKIMTSAQMLLHDHPVNKSRKERDLLPANSIWLWGHGKPPKMDTYRERFNLSGAVISAVDLIKGIGMYAGLDVINVPGATGWIDTNYRGKAEAALKALETHDYVYVHVEAPDEASHSGKLDYKLKAIEDFDTEVVGPVLEGIKKFGDFRILCTPDHPTPVRLMTHTSDAVPFIIYDGGSGGSGRPYDEASAREAGVLVEEGFRLMEMMLKK